MPKLKKFLGAIKLLCPIDVVDKSIRVHNYQHIKSQTKDLFIHGNIIKNSDAKENYLSVYGADEDEIKSLEKSNILYSQKIHVNFNFTVAQVIWAIRNEMARSVEDVLARRIRLLFLDSKAAIEVAPFVAKIMAEELEKDKEWIEEQILVFNKIATTYTIDHYYE